MDKSAIRKFAVKAKKWLEEEVTQKSFELGITKNNIKEVEIYQDGFMINEQFYKEYEIEQRKQLIKKIEETSFDYVIEEVAYTWFNRFVALRFMEVNDYLPTGVRIFSSIEEGKREPDALTEVELLIDDLDLDEQIVYELQSINSDEELFKYILIKQCNKLGEVLPFIFQEIPDYTELLLPNQLLIETSVIHDMIHMIDEDDWLDKVEIIGWLYQYYISEKKDEVYKGISKNIKVTKENIPAATELFTPRWIVEFMVDNSLGRFWLESHPDENFKDKLHYYLEETEQPPEVKERIAALTDKNLSPEEITFLDPCMGSGHVLVYAFDVFYEIYKSQGYREQDIPRLIIENNLYGLEIDPRAAQLAYFAVVMKARSYDDLLLDTPVKTNTYWLEESNGLREQDIDTFIADTNLKEDIDILVQIFHDAKMYGTLIDVPKELNTVALKERIQEIKEFAGNDLFIDDLKAQALDKIEQMVHQAEVLKATYDIVVTNPPYMGRKGMNAELSKFVKKHYNTASADLSAVFMEEVSGRTRDSGFFSMINQHSWMFLSSFEKLRKSMLNNHQIYTMSHLGARAFSEIAGEVVQTTAFVMRKTLIPNYKAKFVRLVDINNAEEKAEQFFNEELHYIRTQDGFSNIPGSPIAYWASERVRDIFKKNKQLCDVAIPKQGLATGNNDLFLKYWYEPSLIKTSIGDDGRNKKWVPLSKGGKFNKWYGNKEYLVNWENDGYEIRNFKDDKGKLRSRPQNISYYFKKGITWSTLSSKYISFRYHGSDSIFETKGSVLFLKDDDLFNIVFGYLNTKLVAFFLNVITPTMDLHEGPVGRLPFIPIKSMRVEALVDENVCISKDDWDSFETSWDFKMHPLLQYRNGSSLLSEAFSNWEAEAERRFRTLKKNEEELNRIFIELYGLEEELTPEVEEKDVTVRRADRIRDVKSFISYAVGIMFGRYSLDQEGLAYAGGKFDWNQYQSFLPDKDNIIPITDDTYFDDDIVSRFIEILKVTFGEETLEENLDYIAETLKKRVNETSRQRIRRYFMKEFYKDHVQMYQKKPIYWMFQSGKNDGFKALIYLHRYEKGLVSRVRTDYLHVLQRKYQEEIERLELLLESDVSKREKNRAVKTIEKIEKQLKECREYDQVIAHVANQLIELDLDDGVTMNYAKFQNIEVPQGEGKKPLKKDLLQKL